jgi:hypothetical protein
LAHMSNPKHLDLTVNLVQGGVGLACMPDLVCLDVAVSQVLSSVALARMLNPIHLNLAVI